MAAMSGLVPDTSGWCLSDRQYLSCHWVMSWLGCGHLEFVQNSGDVLVLVQV